MEELEHAEEILRDFETNAMRLAQNARLAIGLLNLLGRITSGKATEQIVNDINDCTSNLYWHADGDLSVGDDSDEGYDELKEALKAAVGRLIEPS